MRDNRDQDYLEEFTYDADQGGSDFIDSLPTPEIKTTEDLIAAATPAAPKPTDAMLRGKELSQTRFEGMEPVYESSEMTPRGDPGILLGYKFGMNQVQEPGMTASYSAPVYGGGRAGERQLVDPGGKFLGYEYTGIIDAPKSAEILAIEKQLGKEVNPIYATRGRETRGGEAQVAYGPPIGYSYDNGKSQIVSLNTAGEHQGTVARGNNSGFFNAVLTMLSIAYPPAAPFIQAYRVIEAIDKGDTLGVILNAAGAGRSIPGLDASTVKLLNEVKTGAAVIQAVKTGDPLKILSATANIPNVDPDLKDVGIVLNTAKALKDGDITGAFNGIAKMSDRDSVGRLAERFDDIVNSGDSGGGGDTTTIDNTEGGSGGPTPEEQAAQEQADREQAAREAARASEKNIDDTLTDAGLVSNQEPLVDTLAQEQADREQAARDAIRISEKTIEDQLVDSGLVSKTDDEEKLKRVEVTGKALTDTDLPITDDKSRNIVTDSGLPITGDQGRNRVTDSNLPVNPNVGTTTPTLERKEVSGKREIDTDLPITSDTGGNRVTDSSLPVDPNVGTTTPTLAPKTITGKGIVADDLPITTDTGGNRITDSSAPVNPNVGEPPQELKPVTVTGKRDQELDPVTITKKRIVDEEPTPDGGELKPVTIIGKKETPVIPKLPVIPKVPATPAKPAPAKPAPAKPAPKKPTTPAEQLYQTTTQSNPTTLADIKYYLDMASGGMVPPENSPDPLESLLNQPMSVEELLYHLRS